MDRFNRRSCQRLLLEKVLITNGKAIGAGWMDLPLPMTDGTREPNNSGGEDVAHLLEVVTDGMIIDTHIEQELSSK